MHFDMAALPREGRYKILGSCVVPRPIAWVTSCGEGGLVNAAPYSFFNVLGDAPPTIALGLLARAGAPKDTAANILATGEFVVNLVDEAHAEAMNVTCAEVPADVSEIALAGLATTPSLAVRPPRIASAPVAFECRALHRLETGPGQFAIVAEVLHAHVDDRLILDPERLHFDTPAMRLIGRMHGSGWYCRQTDLFQMARPA